MAFVTIAPGRTDADSPIDQSLMDDISNNLNDLDACGVRKVSFLKLCGLVGFQAK